MSKRISVTPNNAFARFGLKPHGARISKNSRGGVRL